MPIQQKLTPPVLHFSDFAGWDMHKNTLVHTAFWEGPKSVISQLVKSHYLSRNNQEYGIGDWEYVLYTNT